MGLWACLDEVRWEELIHWHHSLGWYPELYEVEEMN